MDKELLDLLNQARAAGANESQMQGIVDAYNQKKNPFTIGSGNQTEVLEPPSPKLAVGADGQLQDLNPTTSRSFVSSPSEAFALLPKKPQVSVAGAAVTINAPIQETAPIPQISNQDELAKQLQIRINNKAYTKEDIGVVAQSMKVSPNAANAFMDGKIGTGTVIHFNDIKATKQDQLKSAVDQANQELGLNDNYAEVFGSADLAGAYLQKLQTLYTSKANQQSIHSVESSAQANPILMGEGTAQVDNTASKETLTAAQRVKSIISNEIIDKISNDASLNVDQKVKKIYSLTDSREKANVDKAINERLSPLRYLMNVATGGNTTEDIDLLNANKAGIEFNVNQTLQQQFNYNEAVKKSIAEEYAAKVQSQEISAEDQKANEYYTKQINDIETKNTQLAKQIQPNTTLYDKYPTLFKSALASAVNEFNAIQSGNVEGYEDGGYKDTSLAEYLTAQGFNIKDQKVQDFVRGDNFKDYSFFGRPLQNIVDVFTNTGKSLLDLTPLRDDATILAEKKQAELFPTSVGSNDEFKLTGAAKTGQNIGNTTGQVIGQGLLQMGTAGLGRIAGLSRVAAMNSAFWSSGTLTSYDQAYKDSYDFIDNAVGRTAYAGLIALANGASEKIFPEAKLFQIPGVKDNIAKLATKVSANELTEELADELLGKAKNAFVDYAVKYGKNVSQETAEEVATDLFESGTRFVFGDPNIDYDKAIESAKNTAIQTAIGTSIIGGFGAHRDVQSERNTSPVSTIYNAAIYHDEALDAINKGYQANLYDATERDAKVAVLNTARQSIGVLDKTEKIEGEELSRPQRELYVANLTAEAVLKGQKEGLDEVGQAAIDEKVSNLQNQRKQILNGEVNIDDNGNIEPITTSTPATTTVNQPLSTETGQPEGQGIEGTIQPITESNIADHPETTTPVLEPKRIIEPSKPISEMNSDELYEHATETRKALNKQDKEFENKTEQEKQDAGYYDIVDNVEDLREAAQRVNFVENSENINELAKSVKSVLNNFDKNNPSETTLAILNAAKKKAEELGIETNDLIKEVINSVGEDYKDKADAEFMMKNAMDKIVGTKSEKSTPVLEPAQQPSTVKSEEVSQPIKAFHGSKGNMDIAEFSIEESNKNRPANQKELGIHFGTDENTRALENTNGKAPKEYTINPNKVLHLEEVDQLFPLQTNTFVTLIDALPDEIRLKLKADKDNYRKILRNQDVDAIRKAITDEGYDVVSYNNYAEDNGKLNYIVLDPKSIAKSENKPIQNEEASKAAEVVKPTTEVSNTNEPTNKVEQPTSETKKTFSTKAMDLAAKIRQNGITPDFLKIDDDPNIQTKGISEKQLSEALARAIEFVADAVDAGTELAKAISDSFNEFKKVYTDNNEPFDEGKIKVGFTAYMKTQFSEPDIKEVADSIKKDEISYNDVIEGKSQDFIDKLNTELFGSKKFNFDVDRFKEQVRKQKAFGLNEEQVAEVMGQTKKLTKAQRALISDVFAETAERDNIAKDLEEEFKKIAKGEKPKSVLKKLSVSNVTHLVNTLTAVLTYTPVSNAQLSKMADFIVDNINLKEADQYINSLIRNAVADVRQLLRAKMIVALQKEGNKDLATQLIKEMADEATQSGRQTQSLKVAYDILGAEGNAETKTEFARRAAEAVQEKARKMTARYAEVISEKEAEIGRLNERLHQKAQASPLINKLKDVISTLCGLRNKNK